MLVFFTTFYLSKEDVGAFDLILITINLLIPFITFQLTDAALRWLLDNESKEQSENVFSTISFIVLISNVLFFVIIILYNYFFSINYLLLIATAIKYYSPLLSLSCKYKSCKPS